MGYINCNNTIVYTSYTSEYTPWSVSMLSNIILKYTIKCTL